MQVGAPCIVIVTNEDDVGKGGEGERSSSSTNGSVAPTSTTGTVPVPTSSIDNTVTHGSSVQADGHVPATGLARKVAKDLGVPLSTVGVRGPGGTVR